MTIAEMLVEQINLSDKFTQDNFGLQVGSSFPEIVREVTAANKVRAILIANFLAGGLGGPGLLEKIDKGDPGSLAKQSLVYHVAAGDVVLGN